MGKDKRRKDAKPKKSDFKAFLKKRAPIYLGLIALFVVFVVPELTKGDLESSLPELAAEEQQIVDILMGYDGPNKSGLTVMEAISMKIDDVYPNERIFDNKKTKISLNVTNVDSDNHNVIFKFQSHKEEISYDWNVDASSGKITANNDKSKHIIELVKFYD